MVWQQPTRFSQLPVPGDREFLLSNRRPSPLFPPIDAPNFRFARSENDR